MKKLLSLLLIVLVALSLFGCEKKEPEQNNNNNNSEPVVVTIWDHTFTNAQDELLKALAEQFNNENEGITVVVEDQEGKGFSEKVYNAVSNGQGPDIIMDFATTASTYVDKDKANSLVVDLKDYLAGTFDATTIDAYVYDEMVSFEDGGMHIMPMAITGPIMYYNKTILEKAGVTELPTTWEEVYEMAKKVRETQNVYGFAFDSLVDTVQSWAVQDGLKVIDAASKTTDINKSDELKKQLELLAEGVEKEYFMVEPSGDYFSNDFNSGNVAAYVGSSAGFPYINTTDEVVYGPFPVWEGKTPWVVAWERSFIAFKSTPEREAAAVKFIEFYVNAENNLKWVDTLKGLSPYKATQQLSNYPEVIKSVGALEALGQQASYGGLFPAITGSSATRSAIQSAVKKIASGTPVAEALAEAETTANDALAGK